MVQEGLEAQLQQQLGQEEGGCGQHTGSSAAGIKLRVVGSAAMNPCHVDEDHGQGPEGARLNTIETANSRGSACFSRGV